MSSHTLGERLQGWIALLHLKPTVVGTVYMLLGVFLAADWAAIWTEEVMRAAAVVFLVICYSFVINDYRDYALDAIAKPQRPLPSGRVTLREARIFAWVLIVAVLLLAATLGSTMLLLTIGTLLLSSAYSFKLKNTLLLGNISIALLDALTIVFGGLIGGGLTVPIGIGFTLIFLFVLAQEVLFAAHDYEGDKAASYQTTANRLGQQTALALFKVLAITFALVALLPALLDLTTPDYLIAAIPLTILPVLATVVLLTLRNNQRSIWIATRIIVLLWLSSFVPIALLK